MLFQCTYSQTVVAHFYALRSYCTFYKDRFRATHDFISYTNRNRSVCWERIQGCGGGVAHQQIDGVVQTSWFEQPNTVYQQRTATI